MKCESCLKETSFITNISYKRIFPEDANLLNINNKRDMCFFICNDCLKVLEIKKSNIIKTIDINTKTWFDKINGNTYFSQQIVLNYGLKNPICLYNPFQYGYGSFEHEAIRLLIKEKYFPEKTYYTDIQNKYIIIRNNVWCDCKKADVVRFGEGE